MSNVHNRMLDKSISLHCMRVRPCVCIQVYWTGSCPTVFQHLVRIRTKYGILILGTKGDEQAFWCKKPNKREIRLRSVFGFLHDRFLLNTITKQIKIRSDAHKRKRTKIGIRRNMKAKSLPAILKYSSNVRLQLKVVGVEHHNLRKMQNFKFRQPKVQKELIRYQAAILKSAINLFCSEFRNSFQFMQLEQS